MDPKATTTPLDLAQLLGAIPLPHLHLHSVPSLVMEGASMGRQGSLLPSILPLARMLKAMVSVLKAIVSNSKAMDSSHSIPANNSLCINSHGILFSCRCIHSPHNLVNHLPSRSRQLSQVFLTLQR